MHHVADGFPDTVLITGMPGAGKSTISELLAAALPRAARIAADDLAAMIVSGGVGALGDPADEAARQVDLAIRNTGSLTHNFTAAGFVTVVDSVIPDVSHLRTLLRVLPPRPTSLVVLAPGAAACRARNAQRAPGDRFDFNDHAGLEASMRSFEDRGWWLDSSAASPDETVEAVLDGVGVRGLGRIDQQT